MIDHIGLNVPDVNEAKRYYDAIMPVLGYDLFIVTDDEVGYRPAEGKPGTSVFLYRAPHPAEYVRKNVGLQHLAFRARSRDQVDDAHAKAVELGCRVLFEPQLFPQYHDAYYATFWFDPHGFLLEIVCHKPPT